MDVSTIESGIPMVEQKSEEKKPSPSEQLPQTSLEEISSTHFHFKTSKAIQKLIDGDAFYKDETLSTPLVRVDYDRAKNILSGSESRPVPEASVDFQPSPELQLKVYKEYPIVIEQLKSQSLLPSKLAELIDKRLLNIKNVYANNSSASHFFWPETLFPNSSDEGGILEVGSGAVKIYEDMIREAAKKIGLDIPAEVLQDTSIRMIIGHEYGHSIDTAIRLLRGEEKIRQSVGKNFDVEMQDINHSIEPDFTENIGYDPRLQDMFPDDQEERFKASNERIAVGYEQVILRASLKQQGYDEPQIDQLLSEMQSLDKKKADAYTILFQQLTAKGLPIKEVSDALYFFRSHLETQMPHLTKSIPMSFGGRVTGYFLPISERQLKEYMDTFYDEAKVDAKLAEKGGEE
jgi:hypothetical protein